MKGPLALIPPLGVRINTDTLPRGVRIRARARWADPVSGIRESRSVSVDSEALACEFFSALRSHVGADLDPFITLTDYANQIRRSFPPRCGHHLHCLRIPGGPLAQRSTGAWASMHSGHPDRDRGPKHRPLGDRALSLDTQERDRCALTSSRRGRSRRNHHPKSGERPGSSTVSDAGGTAEANADSDTH